MTLIGVFVLYPLVKSVLKPALRLTICSCTFILSSELCWLVSSLSCVIKYVVVIELASLACS